MKPHVIEGGLDGSRRCIALVVSRFNDLIGKRLLAGALEALEKSGVDSSRIEVAWVPGAWEIPEVAWRFVETGRFSGVIALGAIIRGKTTHHEHIGREVAARLSRLTEQSGVPVAFGILTTENLEQALERCGARENNKGCEAALHLLETLSVIEQIEASSPRKTSCHCGPRRGKKK